MKHLKPFNESIDDEIKNEIRQSVEDCFLDYKRYSMNQFTT